MDAAPRGRVEALDLIRGIAVLGILAINIGGFAGPAFAILTPNWPDPASLADRMAFGANFLLFEGKMRALFTLLFGASLLLLIERTDAQGGFGDGRQLRRLGWLALFGLLHFYLLWWGDILFLYALCGIIALFMREVSVRTLVITALSIFLVWHGISALYEWSNLAAEEGVRTGTASAQMARDHATYLGAMLNQASEDFHLVQGSYGDLVAFRLSEDTLYPLSIAANSAGETLPLILLGMALYRTGFFTGGWSRRSLLTLGLLGTVTGLALTLGLLGWAWTRDFPPVAMLQIFMSIAAVPHLLAGLGYAALLVLAAPRLMQTVAGRWLALAGRMAFTNYIGTSLLMTALFYGWGLGLAGTMGPARLWLFVALGWSVMLVSSRLWLARFRRGPLEWVWRCLVEWRMLPNWR